MSYLTSQHNSIAPFSVNWLAAKGHNEQNISSICCSRPYFFATAVSPIAFTLNESFPLYAFQLPAITID